MTYSDVYSTLTKRAGLDKKALIGPLTFLRTHPKFLTALRAVGSDGDSRARAVLDWLRFNRRNFRDTNPLARLFGSGQTSDFWMPLNKIRSFAKTHGQSSILGLPRRAPTDKDLRLLSRFFRNARIEQSDIPDIANTVNMIRGAGKLNRKSVFGSIPTRYGRYDITDQVRF